MYTTPPEKDKNNKHWRTIFDLSIITIIAVIVFRNFIFSSTWPGGGDTLGWVSREYLFGQDLNWLSLWRPHSFGFVEGINSIDFFLMLINTVTQSGATTVKAFMFFGFIGAGFSMYALAGHYTKNRLAALSAALVYILNQWYFTQLTEGHLGILFGYSLAPLILLMLVRSLEFGRIKDLTAFGVLVSICVTGFNPISAVIYVLFLALFTVFYLLTPKQGFPVWNRTKRLLKVILFSGVIFGLVSAFYIIPFVYNSRAPFMSEEFGYSIEEAFTTSHHNMSDAFILAGAEEWGYKYIVNVTTEISLQLVPVSAMLFTIFVIAYATVLGKTDRYTLFFLVAGLVSVFLAKGPYPPFGNAFVWAWSNVPHFSVFRAASRFVMVTAICNAFFIALLVSFITGYISKTKPEQKNGFKTNTFSFKFFNTALTQIKKWLHYGSKLLLIVILLSGFLSCWYFFQDGLQGNQPPESYLTPYEWIENQTGDFKVVTVNNSPGEWELLVGAQTDFASSTMPTTIGWGHDIGFDSSFLHGKPVLGDGGHTPASRQFVNFLRYGVSRKFLSNEMLEVLSTFNYKYVVLPEYLTENVKAFFLNQKGTQVVYNQSGSVILENSYHQNRVYSTANNVLVVGGTNSFFSTAKISDLDLNKNAFVFADQFENIDISNDPLIKDSKAILLDDSSFLDLVMVSSEEINVIDASKYAMSSRNFSAYWGKSNSWGDFGMQSFGGYTLSTYGNNKATIPFEAQTSGNYEILVRIGYNQYRGKLMVHVDGAPIKRVHPWADNWMGLKWVNLGTYYFEKGKHYLSLTNDGNGWNDVDAVAVVNSELFENQQNKIQKQIQSYQGRIIHRLTALHSFTEHIPPEWQLVTAPYQGQVLESESPATPITSNITILRENQYMFVVCLAQNPNIGNPQLKIDNTTVPLRHISSNNGSEMYESVPVYLNSSTHGIEIGGSGKIAFDQLICYSLNEDEKIVALTDFELHSMELGWNVSPNGKASSSSVGVWDPFILWADNAVDGDSNTRWASEPHQKMPQWLQIDWEEPQNLTGVRVRFEQAYAEDYSIQTWNGIEWITQARVNENSQLNCTHIFEEPVIASKVRLLITSATSLYDLVSVWEFEAYIQPSISKKVLIPDDGTYRVDFSLVCGPDYGTLDLEINGAKTVVSCSSSETQIIHLENGPLNLKAGEQNITVTANGKADFYAIALSLNDQGDFGFLDNIIEENQAPTVSYEQINSGKYVAHVENSVQPFILAFSESYHPMWKAYIDNQEISSIPTYSILNGFYINKTGSFDVTIYFTGQRYADVGILISGISLIVVIPILVIPTKSLEQFWVFAKQKLRKQNSNHHQTAKRSGDQ